MNKMMKSGLIFFLIIIQTCSMSQREKFKQLNILSQPVTRHLRPFKSNHYLINKLIYNLFGTNDCSIGLFQSNNDILSKLYSISNCYNCRIAITSHGHVTTFKEYRLESESEYLNFFFTHL